jgi:hypothetical protein
MPFNSTQTTTGLTTTTVYIPITDNYNIQGSLQLPSSAGSATAGPGGGAGTGTGAGLPTSSQVVTTVNHNGSPILTTIAGAKGFEIGAVACTAGDTITVVLTSSAPIDQNLNQISLTLAVSEGPL